MFETILRVPEPHWHAVNPWAADITYVPIELLAHCCAGGTVTVKTEFGTVIQPHDATFILKRWRDANAKLDGYILPQPEGRHSIGVRYGEEGSQYFSPYNANPELTEVLLVYFRKGKVDV